MVTGLKRNALGLASSQIGVAALQAVQFVLVARGLGPHEFGKVASALALVAVLVPFSGLGTANVMLMMLARGSGNARSLLGNSLIVATLSGATLIALASVGGALFLRFEEAYLLLILFGVSELIFAKYVDVASHALFGLDRHALAGAFQATLSAARCVGAGLFVALLPAHTATAWAGAQLAVTVVAVVLVGIGTTRVIGRPQYELGRVWADIRAGSFFSIGLSAKSVYTDIDKAVLARSATLEINGAYTAAFRLINMVTTPIGALMVAAQTKMFRDAHVGGLRAAVNRTNRLVLFGLAYASCAALIVYVLAPAVPFILGAKYALTVDALRVLALWPAVQLLQNSYSDALMIAGRQRARSAAQVVVAVLAVALNLALIPAQSWQGAVISSYLCQMALLAIVVALIALALREQRGDEKR